MAEVNPKAPSMGRKVARVLEGSPSHPSYPGRANFAYTSLRNLTNQLHEKQKVDTWLEGWGSSLSFDGRVTLLAAPTFLHIGTFDSAKARGSEHARLALDLSKEDNLFLV